MTKYKHTDKLLPVHAIEILQRALRRQREEYDSGPSYISATAMVGEPLARQLALRNADKIEADVLDSLWALYGSALHKVMEYGEGIGDVSERRVFCWFPEPPPKDCCGQAPPSQHKVQGEDVFLRCGGCGKAWAIISAAPDLVTTDADGRRTVVDFKSASTYAFRLEDSPSGVKGDWEAQLNINAFILGQPHWWFDNGGQRRDADPEKITAVQIFAFLRDFSPTESERDTDRAVSASERGGNGAKQPDYPLTPFLVAEAHLWTEKAARVYIGWRLKGHNQFEKVDITAIPLCSDDARWHKGGEFAVKKIAKSTGELTGNAIPGCRFESEHEAIAKAKALTASSKSGDSYGVEPRPGEDSKCMHYCQLRFLCAHGKRVAVRSRFALNADRREQAGFEVVRWPSPDQYEHKP
jgi:hypothetical protein